MATKHQPTLEELINEYFTNPFWWHIFDELPTMLLHDFNDSCKTHATVDTVVKYIDIDFLISEKEPSLIKFITFIEANHGNPQILVRRLAKVVDRLSPTNVSDIILFLAPFIHQGDFDMQKLYERVNWEWAWDSKHTEEFVKFFTKLAPELLQ